VLEIEDVIKWLKEISLRPCDFATDDFDSYETEHLANEALEICEDAKVFCKERNDALAMLKEQQAEKERITNEIKKYLEEYRPKKNDSDWWYNRKDGICAGLNWALGVIEEKDGEQDG